MNVINDPIQLSLFDTKQHNAALCETAYEALSVDSSIRHLWRTMLKHDVMQLRLSIEGTNKLTATQGHAPHGRRVLLLTCELNVPLHEVQWPCFEPSATGQLSDLRGHTKSFRILPDGNVLQSAEGDDTNCAPTQLAGNIHDVPDF